MKHRRRPYRTFAIRLILVYAIAVGAYVFGLSLLQSKPDSFIRWQDLWVPRLNDVLVVTFFFIVGASVGSFLNVVAWRLPRGGSVNGHSSCPWCRHALRPRDNVPVFGWLWLGGRCRDCRLPISPRYPIVEASVGLSYALVGTSAVMRLNLPYDPFTGHGGPVWIPAVDRGILLTLGFHLVGLAIVWAMALIRIDRLSIPPRLTGFAGIVLVATLLVYPAAMVVPWQMSVPAGWPDSLTSDGWFDASVQVAMRCLTSLAAAGFFARLLSRGLSPGADLKLDPLGSSTSRLLDLASMLGVVALLVGWQATVGVVVVASVLARFVLPSLLSRNLAEEKRWDRFGWFGLSLVIALTVQLTFWRVLVGSEIWPSESMERDGWVVWLLISLAVPIWLTEPTQKTLADVPTH